MALLQPKPPRRGAIAPLAAVMMAFFLALVAFAVDISWMNLTQGELQNAADAAALAGASSLIDDYYRYHASNQTTQQKQATLQSALTRARQAARDYAAANRAGDVASLGL